MKENYCSFINTTKFVQAGEALYFLTENESILGRIDLHSFRVNYYKDTPLKILGNPACGSRIIAEEDCLTIVDNRGRFAYQFDVETGVFSEELKGIEDANLSSDSCAGMVSHKSKHYIFLRDGSVVLWDSIHKTFGYETIEINEPVWACGDGSFSWIIANDLKYVYRIDFANNKVKTFDLRLSEKYDLISNTVFSVHCMESEGESLFFHDLKHVFSFNKFSGEIKLLDESIEADNGSRLLVAKDDLVVFPFQNGAIRVLDRGTGQIKKCIRIPECNSFRPKAYSMTGEICMSKLGYYVPITFSNRILMIDSNISSFEFVDVKCDIEQVELYNYLRMKSSKVLLENERTSLNSFLEAVIYD